MRVIILLALIGTALAVPKRTMRIVGGEDTTVESYGYMSNMQFLYWGIFWSQACGGSLITRTTILSAAHCYAGDAPSSWRVFLGTSLPSGSGGSEHSVSQLIVHAGYNSATLDNDVAIVRLATPAVYSNSIWRAYIAGRNYILPPGIPVYAIGWGRLSSGGPLPSILQHVRVYTIDRGICAARYAYLKTQPGFQDWPDVTQGMLCTGILDVGGKDACQGDSGGPVAHNTTIVIGVTSWGFGCAHEFYPGVNANVAFYSDWIEANGSA